MIRRLFLNEAYNQALKSDMNFTHGAVVVFRGKIVGRGFNSYCNDKYNRSIHAEVSAIHSALDKIDKCQLCHCELVIIRVTKGGNFANSFPCANCQKVISNFNLKKVYYSH